MKLAKVSIENQKFDMLKDLSLGLERGSIWNNLYIPFKYENKEKPLSSEKDELLHLIMLYNFASIDLGLYLCTHKDDEAAIKELTKVNSELEKIKYYFENKYYALSACTKNNVETYITSKWPWERK